MYTTEQMKQLLERSQKETTKLADARARAQQAAGQLEYWLDQGNHPDFVDATERNLKSAMETISILEALEEGEE